MKTVLTLALLGAMAASPALAAGQMDQQRSSQSEQRGMSQQGQSQQMSMNSDTTRQIQQQLGQMGYNAGPVDGVMGQQTSSALRNFQRDQNLPATGRPDQQTLSALGMGDQPQQAQTPDQQPRQQRNQGSQDWQRMQDQDMNQNQSR